MKKIISFFAAVIITSSIFAQEGKAHNETREVSPFTSISVSSGIDVYLVQDDEIKVNVEASKNAIHRIITEVKGETLHIYVNGKFKWTANQTRKVYISAPAYKKITASGGADIRGTGIIKAPLLHVNSSGGADIYLNVETTTIKLNCSGGADISIKGKTEQLTADASGGADIDAKKLLALYADVKALGGTDIYVNVSEKLNANASGGSDINYTGSPKEKTLNESGAGDISRF